MDDDKGKAIMWRELQKSPENRKTYVEFFNDLRLTLNAMFKGIAAGFASTSGGNKRDIISINLFIREITRASEFFKNVRQFKEMDDRLSKLFFIRPGDILRHFYNPRFQTKDGTPVSEWMYLPSAADPGKTNWEHLKSLKEEEARNYLEQFFDLHRYGITSKTSYVGIYRKMQYRTSENIEYFKDLLKNYEFVEKFLPTLDPNSLKPNKRSKLTGIGAILNWVNYMLNGMGLSDLQINDKLSRLTMPSSSDFQPLSLNSLAILDTLLMMFNFNMFRGDMNSFRVWLMKVNDYLELNPDLNFDSDFQIPRLSRYLQEMESEISLSRIIMKTFLFKDDSGIQRRVRLVFDSSYEYELACKLEKLGKYIGNIFAEETFKRFYSQGNLGNIGRHTLDIELKFKDFMALTFEYLGYGKKNQGGKPYAKNKQKLLPNLLAMGVAPIYVSFSINDNENNKYHTDKDPMWHYLQQKNQQSDEFPIGNKAPLFDIDEIDQLVDVLLKGFEAGLSFPQIIYYAGSSRLMTINSQTLKIHEVLGFDEPEFGQAFMEKFGLAGKNHEGDPAQLFDDNGLPKEGTFFDSAGNPVMSDGKGEQIWLVNPLGFPWMNQWWWNILHMDKSRLPDGTTNYGHVWAFAPPTLNY